MPNHYVYLISSLPMLNFGQEPPFSFETLLLKCAELIPQQDWEILKGLSQGDIGSQKQTTLKKWLGFEMMLKNELVRARSLRHKVDPAKYLRPDGYAGQSFYHAATAACKSPSLLEGEKILDIARWNYLDELSFSHYFDLDLLIIYALKLLILERWERINSADKEKLLNEALS